MLDFGKAERYTCRPSISHALHHQFKSRLTLFLTQSVRHGPHSEVFGRTYFGYGGIIYCDAQWWSIVADFHDLSLCPVYPHLRFTCIAILRVPEAQLLSLPPAQYHRRHRPGDVFIYFFYLFAVLQLLLKLISVIVISVKSPAQTMGLHTSWIKTKKLQSIGCGCAPPLTHINGQAVEATECFMYLGSDIDSSGRSTPEVIRHIGLAMGRLTNVWRQQRFSLTTKLRLYDALVVSIH